MLKDITLGQFFPGDTVVHRLDPRTKLLLTIIYIAALFTAKSFVSYALMLCTLATIILLSRIKLKVILKSLKPMLFIIAFAVLLNLLYSEGEPLVEFWVFKITVEGIVRATFMMLRISMLITGTFLLTYTTSPIALTDGLELLLNPLKKIRLPIHELAMMMSMALRFIPSLIEEADKIMSAQKARGASFDTGSLAERARALLPLLVPLFVSAIRRADELADAMDCRCYTGGEGRTRMKQLHMQRVDTMALVQGLVLLGGVITLAVFGL